MNKPIYFGANTVLGSASHDAHSVHHLVQEFATYVATVWIHQNDVPDTPEALATFDVASLIPEYKAYIAAGARLPLDRGQTLEEAWKVNELYFREPLICIVNSHQPPDPSIVRVTRKALLEPDALVTLIRGVFSVPLDLQSIAEQDRNRVDTEPIISMLVYDGQAGHVVNIRGITRDERGFVYWDPWPRSSFLCKENNALGVAAKQIPNSERLWLITPDDLKQVVFAVILPQTTWDSLMGKSGASSISKIAKPSNRIRPSDAEQQVTEFLRFCLGHNLLTEQGVKDLISLYQGNILFDRDRTPEGHTTLYNLIRLATQPLAEGIDRKEVLNQVLRNLAAPTDSIHQL